MTLGSQTRIYVAGHRGLVGSALWKTLQQAGCHNLIGRSSQELNLRDPAAVRSFFSEHQPEIVFLAAAKVGGIHANHTYPVDFLLQNLEIQNHVLTEAHRTGVRKLLFLGSSCIYPKHAPQPIQEKHLMTGPLESTNAAYAIAKIAGIHLCQAFHHQYGKAFISVMPTNLYGPGDNYHPEDSHVLPGLLRRFHDARIQQAPQVTCWGSGSPLREFLHADDLARACLHLIQHYDDPDIINVGSGQEVSIRDLAEIIRRVVGFEGEIVWDTNRPDGTPRKLLDSSRIRNLGWEPVIPLEEGIRSAYQDFLTHLKSGAIQ